MVGGAVPVRELTRERNVRRRIPDLVAATALAIAPAACSTTERAPATRSAPAVESIYTSLRDSSCARTVDAGDPNDTPYYTCPGVGGYRLIVRTVDAGRESIDVVDAANRAIPLDYPETVTPSMFALRDQAQWRVTTTAGTRVPIALIVPIEAHESADDPAIVTRTYLAVAKLAPGDPCVVDTIIEGDRPAAEVLARADSAPGRPCVPRRPR